MFKVFKKFRDYGATFFSLVVAPVFQHLVVMVKLLAKTTFREKCCRVVL